MSLPWMADIGRPQVKRRLPVVLSQAEVLAVLHHLEGTHRLLAHLLYGTGMRITEALQLRVKDLDFDHGALIVREGKGGKKTAAAVACGIATSRLRMLLIGADTALPFTERRIPLRCACSLS